MIRELPQLQGVSHTKDLPPEQKRRPICLGEKATSRGSAKRSSHHSQGVMVDSAQRTLTSLRLAIIYEAGIVHFGADD